MRGFLFALFLAVLSCCAHAPNPAPPSPKLLAATVKIETSQGLGSGFAVGPHTIATAAHVAAADMEITTEAGETCTLGAWAVSGTADVAIIEVFGCTLAPLPIAQHPAAPGLTVWAAGHPMGLLKVVSRGVVTALDPRSRIWVDAPINPGMSGGPLTNDRGEVIGVIVAIFTLDGAWAGIGIAEPVSALAQISQF